MKRVCPSCGDRLPKHWEKIVMKEQQYVCPCGQEIVFRYSEHWLLIPAGITAAVLSYNADYLGAPGYARALSIGLLSGLVAIVGLYVVRSPRAK